MTTASAISLNAIRASTIARTSTVQRAFALHRTGTRDRAYATCHLAGSSTLIPRGA
jgi:hypothetical protein